MTTVAAWTPKSLSPVPAKKQAILDAGLSLVGRHGVRRVTVEEISRVAAVSKVTFYKYFRNKNELVKVLLERRSDAALRRVDEVMAMDLPLAERVRILVDLKIENTKAVSETFIDEFYDLQDPDLAEFAQGLVRRSQEHFVAALTSEGQFRSIHPEFIIAILGKLDELARDPKLKERYPDWVSFTQEIVDFFFYGMSKGVAP